jgi:hypothetical protein
MAQKIYAFAVLALLTLALPPTVNAQQPGDDRRTIRVAVGVVSQQGTFGDDNPLASNPQAGATLSLVVRRHPAHRFGLAFDAAIEPTAIHNPHFDESVRRAFLQVGAEIGRRIYVRPMIGGSINAWSGSFSEGSLGLAPAVSLAVGYRRAAGGGWLLQPEVISRAAVEIGAVMHSVGIQLAVTRRGW